MLPKAPDHTRLDRGDKIPPPVRPVVETEKRKYLSKHQFAQKMLDQGGKCAITGKKLKSGFIDVDHRIPLSQGGTNDYSNMQLVDRDAHKEKSKGDKTAAAKIARLKGDKGQLARRKRNGSKLGHPFLKKKLDGKVVAR